MVKIVDQPMLLLLCFSTMAKMDVATIRQLHNNNIATTPQSTYHIPPNNGESTAFIEALLIE
jgi:hypothetical protein